MSGGPLPAGHGAPLRLVAPRRHGDKNIKHLASIGPSREPAPGLRPAARAAPPLTPFSRQHRRSEP
jgi:DMSO/TMAO reductase YedYZ molybdopterin-dependent catalytic subunit